MDATLLLGKIALDEDLTVDIRPVRMTEFAGGQVWVDDVFLWER